MIRRLALLILTSGCLVAAAPAAEEILAESEMEMPAYDYGKSIFKLVVTCSLLLLALGGGGYLLRKMGRSRLLTGGSNLKVLERRPLSQKSMVYLMEIEGRKIVVGDSANGGLSTLLELEPKREGFRDILEKRIAKEKSPLNEETTCR